MQRKWQNLVVSLLVGASMVLPLKLNAITATIPYNGIVSTQPDALDLWLDKLASVESGNNPTIRVLDTNSKFSYGLYQYQLATWLKYGKMYSIDTSLDNIYDGRLQRRLTRLIIENDYSAWRNWRNSCLSIGLPPLNFPSR